MPSRAYFLDASALVHKYSNLNDPDSRRVKSRLTALFAESARKRADLQIPNICMAECAKTFSRLAFQQEAYGEGEEAKAAFRGLRDALLSDVSRDRIICSYELKRAHFVDIEEIFLLDHQLPPPRGFTDWLSSHDALIISMATEFAQKHRNGNRREVVIVTCDRRIAEFCARHPADYASAVNVLERDVV